MRRAVPMLVLLMIGLASVVPDLAVGQTAGELTVDELVARALADNPDLKAARIDVEASAARVRQAGLRPNPMLELGGQKAISPDNNLSIGVSLPLDLNGRKEGRIGVAERELDTKRRQVADRERRLRADVGMKAGEVLAAQRSLRVIDDLLRVNRAGLAVVGNRVREGAAPALDENLQVVEVNRLEASRHLGQGRVEIAALQLKALVGMAPDAPLAVKGDLTPSPQTLNAADAMQRAITDRADVAVARAEVAMAAARAAERRVEFAVLTVQQEVAAAFTQYEAAQRSLQLYERGVRDVAGRNLGVVRQAYELGRGSLLDVIAEQRRYIEIENGYTDALKQVYDAAVDIERAVGVAGR